MNTANPALSILAIPPSLLIAPNHKANFGTITTKPLLQSGTIISKTSANLLFPKCLIWAKITGSILAKALGLATNLRHASKTTNPSKKSKTMPKRPPNSSVACHISNSTATPAPVLTFLGAGNMF